MTSIITLTPVQIAELNDIITVLTETNVGLTDSLVNLGTLQSDLQDKDQVVRAIHEAIETEAILPLEAERRQLVIPGPTVASPVTEAVIVASVTNYALPLFPTNPPSGTPILPVADVNLFGGSGVFAGNERAQIDIEQLNAVTVAGQPPPLPARAASPAGVALSAAVTAQITALGLQVSALTSFLANNPAPNEYVTAGDISDATTASAAASVQLASDMGYAATLLTPFSGYSNANMAIRAPILTARETFIDVTRTPQLTALVTGTLTRLWGARFIWITTRARMDTGTLAQYANTGQAVTNTTNQIATNAATIADINTVLAAQ